MGDHLYFGKSLGQRQAPHLLTEKVAGKKKKKPIFMTGHLCLGAPHPFAARDGYHTRASARCFPASIGRRFTGAAAFLATTPRDPGAFSFAACRGRSALRARAVPDDLSQPNFGFDLGRDRRFALDGTPIRVQPSRVFVRRRTRCIVHGRAAGATIFRLLFV